MEAIIQQFFNLDIMARALPLVLAVNMAVPAWTSSGVKMRLVTRSARRFGM